MDGQRLDEDEVQTAHVSNTNNKKQEKKKKPTKKKTNKKKTTTKNKVTAHWISITSLRSTALFTICQQALTLSGCVDSSRPISRRTATPPSEMRFRGWWGATSSAKYTTAPATAARYRNLHRYKDSICISSVSSCDHCCPLNGVTLRYEHLAPPPPPTSTHKITKKLLTHAFHFIFKGDTSWFS